MTNIQRQTPYSSVRCALRGVSALALVGAGAVVAAESAGPLEEVLVTGTQVRGADPVGSVVIGLDEDSIDATGATTTAELLSRIPQTNEFGGVNVITGGNNVQLTVNRVNLRNIPQGVGAAAPTLLLLNGHRMVGVGVQQNYPDPDVVPPDLLQRVEIITDGGSAIYGADAIGGVVNFITNRDFAGARVSVKQGIVDDYDSSDVNLTVGRDWGETSAAISYNYSQHDAIYGRDRNYVRAIDWETRVPRGRSCNPGNVTIEEDTWAIDPMNRTLALGLANACDTSQSGTIYPEGERHSFFAGFSHTLGERVKIELDAWYTGRDNRSDEGPLEGSTLSTSANPNYISTGGATALASQTVSFDFSPLTGRSNDQDTNLETWGISPSLTWDIGAEWQLRAYYNYGYSETDHWQREVNAAALGGFVADGSIDPYDVARSDPAAVATVLDWILRGDSEQELHNVKAVFDGPVFELPGGAMRLALGAEYLDEYYEGATGTGVAGAPQEYRDASRDVEAFFAEANIPIVGDDNQLPGVQELTLSLAYRYDDYSDFGEANSPSLALDWKPLEWLTLRGRWGEAFQAPGLADLAGAESTVTVVPFVPGIIANPDVPPQPGQWVIAAQGTRLPLDPQKAENWNVGFDIDVPCVDNLTIGASMYRIEYEGQISIPPVFNPGVFYPNYPDNFLMLPSAAEAEAFLLAANTPSNLVADAVAQLGANELYAVLDARALNLGEFLFEGYDLFINYDRETSFGSVFTNVNGTYQDKATNKPTPAADEIEEAGIDRARMRIVWEFGAYIGAETSVRAAINYNDDFKLSTPAELNQTRVDDWYTVDLYVRHDLRGSGWMEDLTVSLGATNLLDEEPPTYRGEFTGGGTNGYAGFTLGRVVTLGLTKSFSF